MSNPELYWKFVRDGGYLSHDMSEVRVETGMTLTVEGDLKLCDNGIHYSERPINALKYAPGGHVCLVRPGQERLISDDKACAAEVVIVAHADATRVLHEFAIWCAERALALIDNPDSRSLAALKTKRRWLDGKANDEELAAAGAVAKDAAWNAVGSADKDAAWAAAGAVAWDAAWDAAGSAAWDAAWAASWAASWAVAWDAAWAAQNDELERRLRVLLGVAA